MGESEYDAYDNWRSEEDYGEEARSEDQNQEEEVDQREAEVEQQQENRPTQRGPLSPAEINRLIEAAFVRERANVAPPVPAEENLPFGDQVARESPAHQAILDRIRPFYSQVKSAEYCYWEDFFGV